MLLNGQENDTCPSVWGVDVWDMAFPRSVILYEFRSTTIGRHHPLSPMILNLWPGAGGVQVLILRRISNVDTATHKIRKYTLPHTNFVVATDSLYT